MVKVYQSGKIELKPLSMPMIIPLSKLANNRNIWLNVRDSFPFPYTEKDAENYIRYNENELNIKAFGIHLNDQFCGCIGITLQEDVYRYNAELGYWVGEPFWNMGIATNAVDLICSYTFRETAINRIYARLFSYNTASSKVLEKNKFFKEGTARCGAFKDGKFVDEISYARLK